jgi:hypothetical protein
MSSENTMVAIMRDCVHNLVGIKTRAFSSLSMVPSVIRRLNEKLIAGLEEGMDTRGLVDIGIVTFEKTMRRSQTTYYFKKTADGKRRDVYLLEWMNRYVNHLKERAGDSPSNVRKYMDEIVLDVFEGESRRYHDEHPKEPQGAAPGEV